MRNESRARDLRPVGVSRADVRCAIYTRKSTDEGLDQAFNTLDAQREASEAFINSQRHEGWTALPQKYDDGGFTGANMDRPALKRLLADVEAGLANCVVVYKVDRLTRSLLDFARIMEVLDKQGASFVSDHPAVQHHIIPGPPDAQHPAVIRPVRTRDDLGAHSGQDGRRAEEREMGGRQPRPRL